MGSLIRRRERKQRNRRLGAGALALVVAAAAIAGVVRAFDLAETSRPAELPNSADSWTRIRFGPPGSFGQLGITAITPWDSGLVAVGFDDGPAVWTSPDGRGWSRVPADLGVAGETMWDVTPGGPGLVAVGLRFAPTPGDTLPLVWTSADALTWNRAPFDPVFRAADLSSVIAGGPGLVAVGRSPFGPSAWFSTDGMHWQRAEVPLVPANAARESELRDVAVVGGRLVAAGSLALESGDDGVRTEMILWTSTDGMQWTEVALDPGVFAPTSEVRSLASSPNGLVAVGWHHEVVEVPGGGYAVIEPAAWTSPDGLRWHRAPADQDAFVSRYRVEAPASPQRAHLAGFTTEGGLVSVAAGSGGYVAVGGDGAAGDSGCCPAAEAAVWTSVDGVSWVRVPTEPVFQISPEEMARDRGVRAWVVVAWGSRFIAAGQHGDDFAIWISEPAH
jgi:hypothetical protein